ncbi:MAG: hypothetical protein ACLFVK_00230 [Dehalococcoidia bacterium]
MIVGEESPSGEGSHRRSLTVGEVFDLESSSGEDSHRRVPTMEGD